MSSAAGGARGHVTCPCCKNPDRPMVCAPCTATALRARRWTLQRLRGAHERARADLASALSEERRRNTSKKDVERLRARLDERRSRLAALRKSVEAAKLDATRTKALNASREKALKDASRQLKQRRAELFSLAGEYPDARRTLAMRLKTAEDAFAKEACFALADLKLLVPVAAERPDPETSSRRLFSFRAREKTSRGNARERVPFRNGEHNVSPFELSDGIPTAVRVCGFRAPDPGDLAEFRAEELSMGLGVLLLFTETASKVLGAVRIARCDGAGSSRARVWTPNNCFEEEKDDACKLPLFLPQHVVEANGGGLDTSRVGVNVASNTKEKEKTTSLGALVYGTVEKVTSTGATAAARGLANVASLPNSARFTNVGLNTHTRERIPDPLDPTVLARHRAELHRAVATLHRHAGATCVELERILSDLSGHPVVAPKKWGPFASLAFLVTEASRRARNFRDAEREAKRAETLLADSSPRESLMPSHSNCNPFRDDDDNDAFDEYGSYGKRSDCHAFGLGSAKKATSKVARSMGQSLMTSVFGGGAGLVNGKRAHFRARVTRQSESTGWSDEPSRGRDTDMRDAFGDASVAELAADGWDLVEHPARALSRRQSSQSGEKDAAAPTMLPPPPSAPEDVEHWTRAMYVDARR